MLSKEDIATLNAARDVLSALEDAAVRADIHGRAPEGVDGLALGRVAAAARVAGNLVFNVLNVTSNYGKVEMSEDELHNRKVVA